TLTVIWCCSGLKSHGRLGEVSALKRTVTSRSMISPVGGGASARMVVPPNPVTRQNKSYSGTDANANPAMQATTLKTASKVFVFLSMALDGQSRRILHGR